jgi:hypothetical protein
MMRTQAITALVNRNRIGGAVAVTTVLRCRRGEADGAILAQPEVRTMSRLVHRKPFQLATSYKAIRRAMLFYDTG